MQKQNSKGVYTEETRKVTDNLLLALTIWPGEDNNPTKCGYVMDLLKKKEQHPCVILSSSRNAVNFSSLRAT
jgi:hypothetical protein